MNKKQERNHHPYLGDCRNTSHTLSEAFIALPKLGSAEQILGLFLSFSVAQEYSTYYY